MKMQNKLAVVLAAAALLALGATSAFAAGWVQEGAEWRYVDNSGDYVTDTMKKSGNTTFYLDENGYMAKDYFTEYNENKYYFGSNGAMVTNTWVAIDPSLVDNDDMGADVYWFYFQETGKAVKGNGSTLKKKTIDGKTYGFDEEGKMLVGWITEAGEHIESEDSDDWAEGDAMYYAGADGVLRGGWLAWTNGFFDKDDTNAAGDDLDLTTMYFYFNPSNFKITADKEKTINGKKYRFNDYGRMMSGWQYLEQAYGEHTITDMSATQSNNRYYSGEDDGHLVRKGWIYAVPSSIIDKDDYDDDEAEYFYANNNGNLVVNQQKRINGKYYVFDDKGIMQTGLIVLNQAKEFEVCVDTEYTDGNMISKAGFFYDGDPTELEDDGTHSNSYFKINLSGSYYSIHYFGDDGAKVTGNKIVVEFADENYVFASKNKGGNLGLVKKKFYSNGILLKASDDLRLGLLFEENSANASYVRQGVDEADLMLGDCHTVISQNGASGTDEPVAKTLVVNASGTQKKKGKYKDADGNFWLINENKYLVGIFDCDVKWSNNIAYWKSDFAAGTYGSDSSQIKLTSDKDDYFMPTEYADRHAQTLNNHKVSLNNDYCLNFYLDSTPISSNPGTPQGHEGLEFN